MYCFVLLITLLFTISEYATDVHNTHYANMNEIQKMLLCVLKLWFIMYNFAFLVHLYICFSMLGNSVPLQVWNKH